MPARTTRRDVAACVLLFACTFLLYAPTLRHGFLAYDDPEYVTANDVVQRGLSPETVRWAFTTTHFANWLPVTWLSHLADVSLFGLNASGHHATSVLLHALNACLLFALTRAMTGRVWRSLAVAALFAAHPLRVESVAWIAERKDVLAGTFFLLTLFAYQRFTRRRSAGRFLAVVVPFALGLMSKTMLVTVPALLLLLDWWPLRRAWLAGVVGLPAPEAQAPAPRPAPPPEPGAEGVAGGVAEKAALLPLSAVACAWTITLQRAGGTLALGEELTYGQRAANAVVSVVRYLGKTAWPADLSVFYPHPGSWPAWQVAASASLVAAGTAAAWSARRAAPYFAVGWLWFLGMLVPVSGILQAGLQSMADRYTYLPGIGLAIAAVWGAADVLGRLRAAPAVRFGLAGAVVAALAAATLLQQRHWRDTYTLFSHALDVDERNWQAHGHVASELVARARHDEAIRHFRRSIELRPAHATYYNLGNALLRSGSLPEAEEAYRGAVRILPDHAQSRHNLGVTLALRRQTAAAADQFAQAVRLDPDWAEARVSLATVLADLGREDQARVHLSHALAREPNNARALRLLNRLGPPAADAPPP